MKKLIIPTFCFAVLSTVAFEEKISAAPLPAEQINTIETSNKYVNVSSGSLNMRKSASENAGVVAKLSKGMQVTVYSESKGWAKIKANGKEGYVSTKYLSTTKPVTGSTPSAPVKATTKYVNVSSGTLNMRKSGTETASIVAKLSKGMQVTVYSESKGWAKIKANGKEGYVSTKYLSTTKPVTG
ncbi:SH3 domain-containing protein, partial [Peribacillus butanolivorans]|uniref:SH3 domain-containing protein n=3 Tax=Peribacillus butanolivorans TaxID=421767 RepID=UPI0036A96397